MSFYVTAVLKGRGDKLVEVRDRTNARMQFGIVEYTRARVCDAVQQQGCTTGAA